MNKQWNALLENNEHSIFHTQEWIDVLTEKDSFHPYYYFNEDATGGIVFMTDEKEETFESMQMGTYGGIIGADVNLRKLYSVEKYYLRVVDYYDRIHYPDWDYVPVSTYILNLKNVKTSHGIKDNLRAAKKSGLKIVEASSVEEFYKVLIDCYRQFIDADYVRFEYIQRLFNMPNNMSRFYLTVQDGVVTGCSVHLFYRDEIFNLYNIGFEEYKNHHGITAIMNYVIETYGGQYAQYNLGASPSDGTTEFKRAWGAEEKKYGIKGKIFKVKYA